MKKIVKFASIFMTISALSFATLLGIGYVLSLGCEDSDIARNRIRHLEPAAKIAILNSCRLLSQKVRSTSSDLRFGSSIEPKVPEDFILLKASRLVVTKDKAIFVLQKCFDSGVFFTIADLDKDTSNAFLSWGDTGNYHEAIQIPSINRSELE